MSRRYSRRDYLDDEDDYADDYYYDEVDDGDTWNESGSTHGAEGDLVASWNCSACTFRNKAQFLSCEICGTVKDATSSSGLTEPFKFDTPSPDDFALGVQGSNAFAPNPNFQPIERLPKASKSKAVQVKISSASEGSQESHEKLPEVTDRVATLNLAATGGGTAEKKKKAKPRLPLESYETERWIEEASTSIQNKDLIHLVVIGHVDAGKSTLMGHLLYRMGQVSKKEMHKNEKEAKEKGKSSFAFAWILDEGSEERARGVTMSVAMSFFETQNRRVVLLDAPGHRDFVPSMISGTSQADAAILVVDASPGGFQSGMEGQRGPEGGGQTREHTQLAKSLGVDQIVVAVNKMDSVGYDSHVFEYIKEELGPFLKGCGFKDGSVQWVPISGLEGENLNDRCRDARLAEWYQGPSLLEAIDSFQPPARLLDRPLRLIIAETLRTRSLGQSAVSGKLQSGGIKPGIKVLVQPIGEVATVKAIERESSKEVLRLALAGDSLDVGLLGVDPATLLKGGVLSHPEYPVPVVTRFEAQVLTLGIKVPLMKGTQVVLHCHTASEAAYVAALVALLNSKTGKVTKERVRAVPANQTAIVEIVVRRAVCMEEYKNFKALGRVALRDGGKTLAVGIVTKILEES